MWILANVVATIPHQYEGKGASFNAQYYVKDCLFYATLDAVHIQGRELHPSYIFSKMEELKKRMKFRLIYEVDDILLQKIFLSGIMLGSITTFLKLENRVRH